MDQTAINAAVATALQAGCGHQARAESPDTVLLFDADGLNYSCAGNDDTMLGTARKRLIARVEELRALSGAGICEAHLTHPASTKAGRYEIATVKPYQGNRKANRKPKNWQGLREFLESYNGTLFEPISWLYREADDGIAYKAAYWLSLGKKVYISSQDKDLRMIEGVHHIKDGRAVFPDTWDWVDPEDGKEYGFKWFLLQMLQGDQVDNIPGLPKLHGKLCGPARASAYLAGLDKDQATAAVVTGYKEYYGEDYEARLKEQSALLWLRRDKWAQEEVQWPLG